MRNVRVTVAVINYNGRDYLRETIESVEASDYPNFEIIFVDDGSTDDSVELIRKTYPRVKIIEMGENVRFLGRYPLANRVRNRALLEADTRFVFLVDNDVILSNDCLNVLVNAMGQFPDCAVCTPRVVTREDKNVIYLDGTELHYVCSSIVKNRGQKISDLDDSPRLSLGCGIELVDKAKAEKIGYTNEDYTVGWGDDGEFHHRMNMMGYRCYHVPRAVVYHPQKVDGFRTVSQVRNRWYFLLHMYASKTLMLILPALLVYELFLVFFLIMKKNFKEYIISIQNFAANLNRIMKQRKKIQTMRVIPDRDLMGVGDIFVSEHVLDRKYLRLGVLLLNRFFSYYWMLVRRFL